MTFSSLFDRLDDWINPIVVKEVRQAVKSRLVVSVLMVFLVLMLVVMGFALTFQQTRNDFGGGNSGLGREVFSWLQGFLLPTIMLVVPVYAAIRMGAERSETNADLLFISTLSPSAIISGKFVASLVFAMLIFSIFAPFMVFTYLLRGVDMPTILFVLWMDLMGMFAATMFALFLASIPGALALRVFAVFSGFMFVFLCFGYVFGGSMAMIWSPQEITTRPEVMWPVIGAVTTLVVANLVLLYFYAVALVSPISSNRILPIRLTLLINWVTTGGAMAYWSINAASMGLVGPPQIAQFPIALFLVYNMIVLSVQFLISTCERDSWGPRVARTIPKNLLLRIPAFLLYTGAAGGVLFSLGLMAATLLVGALAEMVFEAGGEPFTRSPLSYTLRIFGVSALYVVCYGLSGAVVRYFFLRQQIRNAYTWVITACLVGVGSILPWILSIVVYSNGPNGQSVSWWLVPNPFAAAFEFSIEGQFWRGGNELFLSLVVVFLCVWLMILTVPTLFWIVQQAMRFHPHRRKAVAADPVAVPVRAEVMEPVVLTALPVDATAIREEPGPPSGADPSAMTPGRAE
jgi:hypothetical protein